MVNYQSEDMKKIIEMLRLYSDAYISNDATKIKEAVHSEVRFIRIQPGIPEVYIEDRTYDDWKDRIESSKQNNIKYTTKVESIDIVGVTASVKMRWIAETEKSDYYGDTMDYLTLAKIENKWIIVCKVCNSERKKKS